MITLLVTLSVARVNSQTDLTIFREKNIAVDSFTKLIVKSKLRIVLVESDQLDSIRIEGNNNFVDKVFVAQSRDKLLVRSIGFKDLKKEGTIYIPVRSLQSIEVLDDAKIISFSIINSPILDLLIQGDCTVSIILKGKLNIIKGEDYTYSFRRITKNSNTPTYQQSIFNH